jgi:hypothetical protein
MTKGTITNKSSFICGFVLFVAEQEDRGWDWKNIRRNNSWKVQNFIKKLSSIVI